MEPIEPSPKRTGDQIVRQICKDMREESDPEKIRDLFPALHVQLDARRDDVGMKQVCLEVLNTFVDLIDRNVTEIVHVGATEFLLHQLGSVFLGEYLAKQHPGLKLRPAPFNEGQWIICSDQALENFLACVANET